LQDQNGFIWWNRLRNGCARPENMEQWLLVPSWITPPFWSLKKSYFYNSFFMNWYFQIQSFKWFRWKIDIEKLTFRVWRWSANPQNSYFFLWSRLRKYVIRSTLRLIAHETVFSYNCSPIIKYMVSFKKMSTWGPKMSFHFSIL
jgi:hypothetical protein